MTNVSMNAIVDGQRTLGNGKRPQNLPYLAWAGYVSRLAVCGLRIPASCHCVRGEGRDRKRDRGLLIVLGRHRTQKRQRDQKHRRAAVSVVTLRVRLPSSCGTRDLAAHLRVTLVVIPVTAVNARPTGHRLAAVKGADLGRPKIDYLRPRWGAVEYEISTRSQSRE